MQEVQNETQTPAIEGATDAELQELVDTDPVAALLSNTPHKSRAIAEQVVAELKEPSVRWEQSDAEKAAGLPARAIRRDMRQQTKFLSGRFYPAGSGKREIERRIRQQERLAAKK